MSWVEEAEQGTRPVVGRRRRRGGGRTEATGGEAGSPGGGLRCLAGTPAPARTHKRSSGRRIQLPKVKISNWPAKCSSFGSGATTPLVGGERGSDSFRLITSQSHALIGGATKIGCAPAP
jgi:hypothetical protein